MLTSNQKLAFEKFKKLKVGALFMKQGTGKTRIALELINSTDSELTLFFCPFSTKNNLLTEIEKWGVNSDYRIVGYETISNSDKEYIELLELVKGKKVFIIADESIFIKNDSSKRYKRLMRLSKHSEYRLILNGSPLTKNEWDIYNQINFLSDKIIGMNKTEFLDTFFKKIKYKKKNEKPRSFYKISEVNIEYLHKLIEPYIFECDFIFDKKETYDEIMIPADFETIIKYEILKSELLEAIKLRECKVEQFQNLAITCFSDNKRHSEICKHIKGQIIVFCSLISEANNIARELCCYKITGETPLKERSEIIEKFKNDTIPLVMTFGTGSFGLNLQFCNRIAFASLTFDYSKTDQALSRIKRIGQNKDVEYTYFKSELGIYNLILENNRKKQNLKELIIDKINKGEKYFEKIL